MSGASAPVIQKCAVILFGIVPGICRPKGGAL